MEKEKDGKHPSRGMRTWLSSALSGSAAFTLFNPSAHSKNVPLLVGMLMALTVNARAWEQIMGRAIHLAAGMSFLKPVPFSGMADNILADL